MPCSLEIELLRSCYEKDDIHGYNYEVLVTNRQTNGHARVIFHPVRLLKQHMLQHVYDQFLERGLKPQHRFGLLYNFYPNGKRPSEEKMRQGVGSYALKEIIADCQAFAGDHDLALKAVIAHPAVKVVFHMSETLCAETICFSSWRSTGFPSMLKNHMLLVL